MARTLASSESENAYHQIKDLILRGKVEPGEFVSILYFADLLEVGRMPATIACQRLEVEGLLSIIPKKGVLITPLTINDVRDMYEAREAIELYMCERAFPNLTASDISALEDSISRQLICEKNEDAYGFMKEDTFFHRYILKRYPNATLLGLFDMMTDRIFIVGVKNTKNPKRMHSSIEEHKHIVACIKNGDLKGFLETISSNQMQGYVAMTTVIGTQLKDVASF